MADKKKKRTILMGEGAPESKEKKKKPWSYYFRTRKGGIGGTIGEIGRGGKLKWKAGAVRGTPGVGGFERMGRLSKKGKSRAGFQIEVKF